MTVLRGSLCDQFVQRPGGEDHAHSLSRFAQSIRAALLRPLRPAADTLIRALTFSTTCSGSFAWCHVNDREVILQYASCQCFLEDTCNMRMQILNHLRNQVVD